MDQISAPMRIVLAVAVVFLAAYMLVLKPKDENRAPLTPATTTPATASASDGNTASTGLGKAVEGARGASDKVTAAQNAEAAKTGDEQTAATGSTPSTSKSTPSTTGKSAPSTAAAKAADPSLAKLPKWLQRSMDKKVVAILFTNDKASDDRRTRAALKHAFTAHGKVVKRAVPISQIARYRSVAEGVDVQQSPTLMVIDRSRHAQALVGYSSVDAINQAIIDGLLATDRPIEKVKYLQTVQTECRQVAKAQIIGVSEGDTFAGEKANLNHVIAVNASSLGTLRNAAAPAAYKGLKHTVNAYLASQLGIYRAIKSQAVGGKTIDTKTQRTIMRRNDKLQDRTSRDLAAVGINACT